MPSLFSFPSLELPDIEEATEQGDRYRTVGVRDVCPAFPTVVENEEDLRNTIRKNAEDAIEDPTMNSQPIEVYMYYAAIQRASERRDTRPVPDAPITVWFKRMTGQKHKIARAYGENPNDKIDGPVGAAFKRITGRGDKVMTRKMLCDGTNSEQEARPSDSTGDKVDATSPTPPLSEKQLEDASFMGVLSPAEQSNAYRLLRVSSWQLVFFLITTDVFGWNSSPVAFSYLGYGPGILTYSIFFLLSFGSGQILWRLYLNMDSERYPIKTYADIGERTFGPIAKHLFNGLQAIQLLFNTAMFIVMVGQGIAALTDFKVCYMLMCAAFAALGILLGQFKTIRGGLGVFTQVNLFVSLLVLILCMVGASQYPPIPANTGHADLSEPIKAWAWPPSGTFGWYQQIVAVQLVVFAYGGAMIFVEFLAEMRRPHDFWKAAFGAQFFSYSMYTLFGAYTYSRQGQYTAILPTTNFDSILYQGLTNIIGVFTVAVVMLMYSHIGAKMLYRNVMRGYFNAPSLLSGTRRATMTWCGCVIAYVVLSWSLGMAIPNIGDLQAVVGSVGMLQFTYTFPMAMLVGHWVQRDANAADEKWEPGMVPWSNRIDTWHDLSRWKRGFRPYWWAKLILMVACLGAVTLCALGVYSGARHAHEAFAAGMNKPFSCRAPGQPIDR